jgi:hypothetical protein
MQSTKVYMVVFPSLGLCTCALCSMNTKAESKDFFLFFCFFWVEIEWYDLYRGTDLCER